MTDPEHIVPGRFARVRVWPCSLCVLALALFAWANARSEVSPGALVTGLPQLGRLLGEMLPPDPARIGPISSALLETLLMAIAGCAYGVLFGFVLAVFATRRQGGPLALYAAARATIAFFRSVPDLIWALLFVVAVGLGTFSGTLAICVDTIGFCGRFFAEAMEEVDPGPQEALTAIGATRAGILFSAIVPAALPAFVNVALYSLEKAVRSSVVLGLVGAGGIGIELKVAMDMFQFNQATTIILLVFAMVVAVEQLSARIRAREL
jgi:phosphonate transport system permease protein